MVSSKPVILVTGGAGYIGSHIVLCLLLTNKFRVCVIENFGNSYPAALSRVSEIALNELPKGASESDRDDTVVKVFPGDLKNAADIEAIFHYYKKEGNPVWGVIHVAALKAVGESGEKPIEYYQNNISATIGLLDVMRQNDCFRLVYSSSATVYGAPKVIPIPETSPLAAESVYGRTKVMSEMIIKDVCDADPRWRAISLRYFNPAGAHPSGLIGEDPHGKPGNLVPLLAQMAVGKFAKEGLKVFGNDYPTPDGTCVRDYIHVMDLAGGHVLCLDHIDRDDIFKTPTSFGGSFGGSGGKYRAFNLGKGKGMSVMNMIEAMKKASGFDYKYEIIGRRTGDVPDLTADPALAEKELGFKASRSLDEMCRDQWNWQSKNPDGYPRV
ncbi:UDP-glucose 4-epimerase [Cystobasidium minutum MCA 4210]|uniref:UDP-glucose 4-epimerase n=1 Tax=Cystobasidium minutum MCA 4210 TaxID=1397322 RepID=UPI0034CEC3ED|eukprot:jgi/Rhomi1/200142/MIX971_5113_88